MYLTLKLLHVAAVVLFLGNIATGLFWKAHADRTGDPRLIAHTLEGVIRSDRLFTIPGVALIILFGFAAAFAGDLPVLRTGWIFWSIVLFTVSGAAFIARVAPLQRQMLAVALAARGAGGAGGAEAFDWARYRALSRRWELWGAIALVTPVAAMALMVLKPAW